MPVGNRERAALNERVSAACLRIGSLMLDPTEENTAQAIILAASLLQDLVRLGGTRMCNRALAMLEQLRREGALAP